VVRDCESRKGPSMTAEAIKATLIVEAIVKDIEGRSGLGNVWEEIDSVVREEILDTWKDIVLSRLDGK